MPHIQQLDPHVADLIAAGEVVERPASVVKELVENAIDAGATAVTVEIQNGGMTLIRVTDNGCGIADSEAETAFLRHATSKIRSEYDLEAIGTLGFRGEALAAIAAVSRVDLLTRQAQAPLGTSVSLEGGAVVSHEEAGCPAGTTMVVRDLFYNTPARLKFMKRDSAEGAAVFAAVQRAALSHPEVSVKFLRDGRQELLTPGDGVLQSAMYAVLGRDMALGLTAVQGTGEDMGVTGFASLPACCRGTRGYQFFFVNGRYVKSRTMTAALEEAYRNQKMVGKFPGCVLHLTTKLSGVDVNVHPTKQEVKFGSEKKVFDTVYYAVKSALEGDPTRVRAELKPSPRLAPPAREDTVTPNQLAFRTMTAEEYRRSAPAPAPERPRTAPADRPSLPLHDFTTPRRPARGEWVSPPPAEEAAPAWAAPSPVREPAVPTGEGTSPVRESTAPPEKEPSPLREPVPPAAPVTPAESAVSAEQKSAPAASLPPEGPEPEPWRVAGEVLHTYIIVEQGDKILFIDKHAAHERMNFDALKAGHYRPMVQELLSPVVLTPGAEEASALLAHLPLLAEFGFDAEDFGGGSLLVRSAPGDIDAEEIGPTLAEIAGKLLLTGRADPDSVRDELMHTMACKAAIKGGERSAPEELERVARWVMEDRVRYCPHGRPVAIELTRGQLEKQFGRA